MPARASEPAPPGDARERLVRAAEELFAEKGFAAAAVHEITDRAGVNRALLYYYFEDKQALHRAVIEEGVTHFLDMLDDALSRPGTFADRLTAFVEGHLRLIYERGTMARVVHRCLLDGLQQEAGLDRFNEAVRRLELFFQDAAAAGEIGPVDPALSARALLGPTFIFSLWRIYEGGRFSREEVVRCVSGILLQGLAPR